MGFLAPVPPWWGWMGLISYMRWAFGAFMINQFEGLDVNICQEQSPDTMVNWTALGQGDMENIGVSANDIGEYDESTMSFHPNCEKCKLANLCPEGATAGTPECLPVVCKTICECRQGLPEPIAAPPIAILPPPEPDWTKAERMQFCACASSRRLTECTTQLCRQKVKSVLDIIQCKCAVPAPHANCPAWAQEGVVTPPGF